MRITALIKHRLTQTIISPSGPTTFEVDELIELPAQDQKVWRYMACDKFADLVRSRKLYCRRLDKLPDALEGLLSAGNFRQMSLLAQARHDGYGIEENRDQEIIESERMRRIFFVNCWHINDSESRTMCGFMPPAPNRWLWFHESGNCALAPDFIRARDSAEQSSARSDTLISISPVPTGLIGDPHCSKIWPIRWSAKSVWS